MAKRQQARAGAGQLMGLRYVGNGRFWFGIPARDLTSDEAPIYWPTIDERQQGGPVLYEPVYAVPVADNGSGDNKALSPEDKGD